MRKPKFTDDEQYVLTSLRSAQGQSSSYMWGYIVCGIVIAGFSAYHGNLLMMLSAFVVVCGFRLYEEHLQLHWSRVFRSIVEKYEQALHERD